MKARRTAAVFAAVASLTLCAGAQAQVTVGELPPGIPLDTTTIELVDVWQGTESGRGYVVPADGVLTSWSTTAAPTGAQELEFKVFHPEPPDPSDAERMTVVGRDGPRTLTPNTVNTFDLSIPVRAGDVIGLNTAGSDVMPSAFVFRTGLPGDTASLAPGSGAVGATVQAAIFPRQVRVNVAATLLPLPAITGISPAAGPFRGSTRVVITGSNFAKVQGVTFGAVPTALFTVDSESQITAVAPPGAQPAAVPVSVTTLAGTATAPSGFTYLAPQARGCRVPKMKGKTLKAARKSLKKSDCRLGKLKRRIGGTTKVNKVVAQRPKPGKLLAPGAKVNLTVVNGPAGA